MRSSALKLTISTTSGEDTLQGLKGADTIEAGDGGMANLFTVRMSSVGFARRMQTWA